MRKWSIVVAGGVLTAACGGGGGSSSDNLAVVSGSSPSASPAATPTPAPSPTPSPTPAATPSSSYPRFADLSENRTFQTSCASLLRGTALPQPQAATAFGDGLVVNYAADTNAYAIVGDGVQITFTSPDLQSNSGGQRTYVRDVAGINQMLVLAQPIAAGNPLDYARTLTLGVNRSADRVDYACVLGVPATIADKPAAATVYAKVAVGGIAYVASESGSVRSYTIVSSTSSVNYDPSDNAMVMAIHLIGAPQDGTGTVAGSTADLGTFTARARINAGQSSFYGQLDSDDRISRYSSLAGWLFGGTETAAAFEILATNPTTGERMSVLGTVSAAR